MIHMIVKSGFNPVGVISLPYVPAVGTHITINKNNYIVDKVHVYCDTNSLDSNIFLHCSSL